MNDNGSPEQETSGTTRRQFLGAAGAAAALAATGTTAASADSTDTTRENETEDAPDTTPVGFCADLELWGGFHNPADYDFRPSQLEDEETDVSLRVHFGNSMATLSFTKSEAEAFADQLTTAAERGAKGRGDWEVEHTVETGGNDGGN